MTDFKIRVIIDPGPAQVGAKKVEGQLRKTEGASNRLRASLLRTFGALGLAVGLAGSIRLLADYSQAMSTVQAVTRATEDQFESLNAKAQELGRNTRFTATQAADGMVLLARAGFTAEESLVAVEGTLKLAQAGGLGLAESANIAANSLRGFRLEVDQTDRVVDVLALAANSANTNVGQLGEGLKFVAPIAAGLGVSLETTTAAVSKLSDSGLQATLAGTGLRRVLSELESPSQKTAQILRDLGISTDDVRVSQVGLVSALQSLKDAGIDTGQALEIFGDRGGPAFEVLSSNIPAVAEMAAKLENAAGTADRVAEVMDDNLNGALLRALSAFQGLILAFGDSGGFDVLESGANGLAATFNFLTDNVEAFGASLGILAVSLLLVKTSLGVTAASAVGATGAFIAQTIVTTSLAFATGGLATVMAGAATSLRAVAAASIANPFLLIVVGAGAAFLAVQKLVKGIEEYQEALRIAEGGELAALSDFAKLGAQIDRANQKIDEYRERLDEGNLTQEQFDKVTASLTTKIANLTAQQDKLSGATKRAQEEALEQAVAADRLNLAYTRVTASLDEEQRLLGLGNQEREIQAALLEQIAAIQEEGGPELTNREREELETLLRRNQALRDQAEALDEIRGPQEAFVRQLTALQVLFDEGRITAEELDAAVLSLAQNAEGIDLSAITLPEGLEGEIDLSDQIVQIQSLIEAEQKLAEQEAARAGLLRDLADPIDELTQRQMILDSLLSEGAVTVKQYADETARIDEAIRRLNPEYALQQQILEDIRGPQEEAANRIAALHLLFADGKITLEEYNAELAKLNQDQGGTSFSDGITAGLDQVGKQIQNIGELSQAALVNGFNAAEDALVEFATTGKISFRDFASSILADLARIAARQLLLGALGGTQLGGLLGITGAASGGDFEPNRTMIVGEKGPELVRFGESGNITPADQTRQALASTGGGGGGGTQVNVAPAEVKLQVVNVDSPAAARDAMDTSEGGKVVMNQIRQNRSAIKRELGIQ